MEIQKPKSHTPRIHDNTEEDLILMPPSVLDNKLRDFEERQKALSGITSDIALAVTLLVAIFTAAFIDFPFMKGTTIRGAFITGFLVVIVKIIYSIVKVFQTSKQGRADIINSLKTSKFSESKKENKT